MFSQNSPHINLKEKLLTNFNSGIHIIFNTNYTLNYFTNDSCGATSLCLSLQFER